MHFTLKHTRFVCVLPDKICQNQFSTQNPLVLCWPLSMPDLNKTKIEDEIFGSTWSDETSLERALRISMKLWILRITNVVIINISQYNQKKRQNSVSYASAGACVCVCIIKEWNIHSFNGLYIVFTIRQQMHTHIHINILNLWMPWLMYVCLCKKNWKKNEMKNKSIRRQEQMRQRRVHAHGKKLKLLRLLGVKEKLFLYNQQGSLVVK